MSLRAACSRLGSRLMTVGASTEAFGASSKAGAFDMLRRSGIVTNAHLEQQATRHFRSSSSVAWGASSYAEEKAVTDLAWVGRLTVKALKDELRSRKLKVSGRKAELIERLQAAL